jgi:hypothetical protein
MAIDRFWIAFFVAMFGTAFVIMSAAVELALDP